jgi:hypothetical protein
MRAILLPSTLADKVLANAGINGPMSSDIPLRITDGGKYKYPLHRMVVGEHFFVPARNRSVVQVQNSLTTSVQNIQKKLGFRFTQRRYAGGIRVWRTQ